MFASVIACCLSSYGEVLFEEDFDRPVITNGLSIADSRLGWKSETPVGADVSLGSGSPKFAGRFLDGSTAGPSGSENLFLKRFTPVTNGIVTLSCVALASSSLSLYSSIGLTYHKYPRQFRGAQWTCVPNGWIFYVGSIDQTGEPYSDLPLGVLTADTQTIICPFDVAVTLKIFVDLNRSKTWGQASWTSGGVPYTQTTAEYNWDLGLGNVSSVFICEDMRSGRNGIDLDNIKIEGSRHVTRPHPFLNTAHTIYQMNGTAGAIPSTAQIQWVNRARPGEGQLPYLAYLPDQTKLIMMCRDGCLTSADGGVTWGPLTAIDSSNPTAVGLVYLGSGKLLASGPSSTDPQWISTNSGNTWTLVPTSPVPDPEIYLWDPPLVTSTNGDSTKNLIGGGWYCTGIPWGSSAGPYSQGCVRFSTNSGATWGNPIAVPQWLGVNEVTFTKAANGNIIAACRTDYPPRFAKTQVDHYGGLAVSISSDNGATWSTLNKLFTWGRHHPSIVLLPNNDLLMTYVVRLGYTSDKDGFPRFGVEAVLSHNNGLTWDIDHRFVLAEWSGNVKGDKAWYGGVQSSSTVVLPSGTIVTAFGVGFNNAPDTEPCIFDIGLIRWTVPNNTLNGDTYLKDFDADSDGRNIIDLKLPTGKKMLMSAFSLGYGFKNGTWNTTETSAYNTAVSGGFTLGASMNGITGSNTGPTFTNRVLGAIGSGTGYQSTIVEGFSSAFTVGFSGAAPIDAAPNPNYQLGLVVNAISVRAAPNIIGANQTVNFYEELTWEDLLQQPQLLVGTASFGSFSAWNKFTWDPEEISQSAGLITQTYTRTFKLDENAGFDVYLDGLEVVGNATLTYDAVKPVVRRTITSSFSKGFGWNGNSWNTSETTSANVAPSASFQMNFGFGNPGSGTLSNAGPTFSDRILGSVAAGSSYQSSYPPGFVATVTGGYIGTIPADATGNPNYKVKIIIDSISVYSAPTTPSPTQTIALTETTSGHTQAQTPMNLTTTGNFTALTSWKKISWNPSDYLSPAGILRQTQSRSFTITESAITSLAIDGFEVNGQIELSYDAEP